MLNFIKQQGFKVALPLLLLTTACGEKQATVAADEALPNLADLSLDVVEADTSAFQSDAAKPAPASVTATIPSSAASPQPSAQSVAAAIKSRAAAITSVPEPVTTAGFGVSMLGFVLLNRRQQRA